MVWTESSRSSSQSSLVGSTDGSVFSDAANELCERTTSSSSHYVPLIDKIHQRINSNDVFFSLEFFPPKRKEAAPNLLALLDRMRTGGPLFIDITWHAAGNPGGNSETSSMTIAGAALNYCGLETMLHLICINLTEEILINHLERAKELGIRNILALRGDVPDHIDRNQFRFRYATDLVQFIRDRYGSYFTIAVAAYPKGHPDSASYEDDLIHLKEKQDAGADFIITQLFFEAQTFIDFVADCRQLGITLPILPGIMPIQSYESLRNIARLSKLIVPDVISGQIEKMRNNDEDIRNYGIELAVRMCRALLDSGVVPGLHMYTLNREHASVKILEKLKLWKKGPKKSLPWLPPANHKRCGEDIRPIFWSCRPKSYVYRTQSWNEFPNGRWGQATSPAFGELKDYYLFIGHSRLKKEEKLSMWGHELNSERDVFDVFYCYLKKAPNPRTGALVTITPWNEEELSSETELIGDKLANFNEQGILTINSQPNVNGVPSTDPVLGWGKPDGYVYGKSYVEFFTCRENVVALREVLKKYPQVNYHILNRNGKEDYSNVSKQNVVAVTWGVFPGTEIIQPTVVDPVSFRVWKDEAFSLWTEWAKLYPSNSLSSEILYNISNSYYLVNLVDNDYPKETCLWNLLDETLMLSRQSRNGNHAQLN